VITAREAVVSVAGSGELAQISVSVIGSLCAKHFKIAHWEHYGFSPIVKTAGP